MLLMVQPQALPAGGEAGGTYVHVAILHLGYGDGLHVPDQLSLGDEPVVPGKVAHTHGSQVPQVDAVKLKCVCGPPAEHKGVATERCSCPLKEGSIY